MSDITPALIDGSEVTSASVTEVRSPYDGSLLGTVPRLDASHIDRAVAVAHDRHLGGALPAHERAAILERAAVMLADRREEFGRSISAEAGKPISVARVEADRAVDTLRFSAVAARSLTGETVPLDASASGSGHMGFVLRVPIGVVAAISPFNFPLNLVCHKVAPAIAAGCPVVLKPASATPLTALRLALLLEEAGLPPGWLNVVTVPGSVADHLVSHPDISLVTFTGSPPVGWGIRARNPRIRVALELGNNAPVIIHSDADIADAARRTAAAGYSYSGQTCISVQRVYAHRSVHAEVLDAMAETVSALVVGDPADDATDVSALITSAESDRVETWVSEALGAGARTVVGGGRGDHGVLAPVLLDGVTRDMSVCHDEVFGPVVGVAAYDDFDDALRSANDTRYGLQAAVFTSDITRAVRAASTLQFGGVMLNEVPSWRADQMPYGGIGDSGNTREGPRYAVETMTERRLVVLRT